MAFSNLPVSNSTASILSNNVAVSNIVFNLPSATQAALQDDGVVNNGLSELVRSNGAVENTIFSNPSNSLTVNTTGGSLVQLTAADAGFHPALETFSGQVSDSFRLANAAAIPGTTGVTIIGAGLDLHGLNPIIDALAQLRAAGAQVDDRVEDYGELGRFGWASDPEGNRFELWEPRSSGHG